MHGSLRHRYSLMIALMVSAAVTLPAWAEPGAVSALQCKVGMEMSVEIQHRGLPLRATDGDDGNVCVRLTTIGSVGDVRRYLIAFIAEEPGEYDLSQHLEQEDGQPAKLSTAVRIQVSSGRPKTTGWGLERPANDKLPALGGYRSTMMILVLVWIAVGIWMLYQKWSRRQRKKPAPLPPLTLADQLRPLIASALLGQLSSSEEARLERLLITYWRARLELTNERTVTVVEQLRSHPDAGTLLGALDRWLHYPPSRRDADIESHLRPYHDVPSIPECVTVGDSEQ